MSQNKQNMGFHKVIGILRHKLTYCVNLLGLSAPINIQKTHINK